MVTSQPTPHLLLHTEFGERQVPLVDSRCWTIGRSDDNTVVLPDRWISRNHAMLQSMESGEYYLIDLGSRNGSFVNGRRVSIPVTLNSGDRLTFGQTELEFYSPDLTHGPDSSIGMDSADDFTATATLHVRRLISVLVVDIRDFTSLTRQLDEQLLSEVIGTWFRHAGEIIRDYGSWVDKYIGDAVMAVWIHGTQEVSSDEMLKVFRALSALHHMTLELNKQYPLPFALRVGAGVNTGYAMVGNTGSGDRPDYTALGDTVNAAFRLETATKQIGLDIALGETAYRRLKSPRMAPPPFKQHEVNLKGYEMSTLAYAANFADLDNFLNWFS